MIELIEPEPVILTLKRKKFVKAKVLQVGSDLKNILKPGDIVTSFNEGIQIKHRESVARIVNYEAIILNHHSI